MRYRCIYLLIAGVGRRRVLCGARGRRRRPRCGQGGARYMHAASAAGGMVAVVHRRRSSDRSANTTSTGASGGGACPRCAGYAREVAVAAFMACMAPCPAAPARPPRRQRWAPARAGVISIGRRWGARARRSALHRARAAPGSSSMWVPCAYPLGARSPGRAFAPRAAVSSLACAGRFSWDACRVSVFFSRQTHEKRMSCA